MENTLENKAKFFAQYYGQDVFRHALTRYNGIVDLYRLNDRNVNPNYSFLELKPLSQITDEDIVFLSKICICKEPIEVIIKVNKYGDKEATNISEHSTWVIGVSGEDIYFKCGNFDSKVDASFILFCYDYLHSKGYALPWMGLSVEKLIEYGWVKFKEQENGK